MTDLPCMCGSDELSDKRRLPSGHGSASPRASLSSRAPRAYILLPATIRRPCTGSALGLLARSCSEGLVVVPSNFRLSALLARSGLQSLFLSWITTPSRRWTAHSPFQEANGQILQRVPPLRTNSGCWSVRPLVADLYPAPARNRATSS